MKRLLAIILLVSTIWCSVPERVHTYHAGEIISTVNFQANTNAFIRAVTANTSDLIIGGITANTFVYSYNQENVTKSYNINFSSVVGTARPASANLTTTGLQINSTTLYAPIPVFGTALQIVGMTVSADAGVTVSVMQSTTYGVVFSTSGNATVYYSDSTVSNLPRYIAVINTAVASKNVYSISILYKNRSIVLANDVTPYAVVPSAYDTWTNALVTAPSMNARYDRLYKIVNANYYSLYPRSITCPSLYDYRREVLVDYTNRLHSASMLTWNNDGTYKQPIRWADASTLQTMASVVAAPNVILLDYPFTPGTIITDADVEATVMTVGGVTVVNIYAINVVSGTRTALLTHPYTQTGGAGIATSLGLPYTVTGQEYFIVEMTDFSGASIIAVRKIYMTVRHPLWY